MSFDFLFVRLFWEWTQTNARNRSEVNVMFFSLTFGTLSFAGWAMFIAANID